MLRRVFVCASGVRRCSVVSVYNSRSGHGSRPGETREAESEREPRMRLAVVGAPR